MLRNDNLIDYGRYKQGIRRKKDTIEMISNEDLRKLYELLQTEFASNFQDGCKHTFGEGWSLNPTIGENVRLIPLCPASQAAISAVFLANSKSHELLIDKLVGNEV